MAYGDLPFQGTGCPVPDVYFYYVSDMINTFYTISTLFLHCFIHLPKLFLPMEVLFGQWKG